MKYRYIIATMLLGGFALTTACNKDDFSNIIPEGAIQLTMEGYNDHASKTSVSGNYVYWVNGDEIKIYSGSSSNNYTLPVVVDGSNANAYINGVYGDGEGEISGTTGGTLRAFYPTSICHDFSAMNVSNPGVRFPTSYSCTMKTISDVKQQVIALPLFADEVYQANYFRFKHLTAAVNVNLKNSTSGTLTIDEVTVKTDKYRLNAGSSIVYLNLSKDNLGLDATEASNATESKMSVTFPASGETALTIGSGSTMSVQVPILPIGEDNLTIEVKCHDASDTPYQYFKSGSCPALARKEMLTARVELGSGSLYPTINLNSFTTGYTTEEITSNAILTGNIGAGNVVIKIADGKTVILQDINSGTNYNMVLMADGDVNVVLSGTNKILAGYGRPAVFVAKNKTLTIKGDGTLNATGGSYGAGIGCGSSTNNFSECGNIVIQSGTVNATGGTNSAGIGTGGNKGNICGEITITTSANVTATKNGSAQHKIGKGNFESDCGTVTTGCTLNPDGTITGGTPGYIE